jgi:hypothetical protein
MVENYVNVFYYENIKKIGGVENSLYQLAKKYHKDYDITIVYKTCDPMQLMRLQKYVRCVKWVGQTINCEKCFYGYHFSIISSVNSPEHILVVHTDYAAQWKLGIKRANNLPNHPKLTGYICVSDVAKAGFEEVMHKKAERCYNVFVPDEPQKVWHFVTWGRIDEQKGAKQYAKFVELCDNKPNFKYDLTVFSDGSIPSFSKNIIRREPRLDVLDYVYKHYDAGVFFSKHESFGYSPMECLDLNIPVICSDLPAYREIGVKDGENGFLIKEDFSNFDLDNIIKTLSKVDEGWKFHYKPPKDDWDKFLIKGKPSYKPTKPDFVMVRCVYPYKDLEWDEYKKVGDIYPVSRDRLDRLLGNNDKHIVRVELVDKQSYVQSEDGQYECQKPIGRVSTWMTKYRLEGGVVCKSAKKSKKDLDA